MGEQRRSRFVVVISTPEEERARELLGRDFSVRFVRSDADGFHAGAVITLDQVGELVEAGYSVRVERTNRPMHMHRFIEFEEWYEGTLADLEGQREKR